MTLLKSSSESICLSEASVCGVAGSAASAASMLPLLEVLLAFRFGCRLRLSLDAGAMEELSSFRLRVTGGVVVAICRPVL